jgi:Protein of unknown function (DUF559)
LDFALFCQKGSADVETDGDMWHATPQRIPEDNRRDNALAADGWHVLRFNGRQVRESLHKYCVPQVTATIERLGGLTAEGLVPRKFYNLPEGIAQQLTLFEERAEYDIEDDLD